MSDAWTYDGFGAQSSYTVKTSDGTVLYARYGNAGVGSPIGRESLGRITLMNETVNGATHSWLITYDARSRLESVTEDGITHVYSYDPSGNLALIDGTTFGTYDAQDQLLTLHSPMSGAWNFGDTNNGDQTNKTGASQDYNFDGNRVTANGLSSTYDAQDRLLTSPGASYTYSDNGDLETKVTAAGTTAYAYDLVGALRSVSRPTGDTVAYVIDGERRRVGRTWTHSGQTVTQGFLYDGPLHLAVRRRLRRGKREVSEATIRPWLLLRRGRSRLWDLQH